MVSAPPPLLLLLAMWLCPPPAVSLAVVALGLPAVLQTGFCPSAPPDVQAYPCTAYDYLVRMTLGPWALVGHLGLALGWTFLVAGGLVLISVARILRSRGL